MHRTDPSNGEDWKTYTPNRNDKNKTLLNMKDIAEIN